MRRLAWFLPLLLLIACVGTPAAEIVPEVTEAPTPAVSPVPLEVEVLTSAPTEEPTPSPTAIPTPSPTPTPTPTPEPTPSPTPAPTPYSIVWLPDTQQLAYSYPEKLSSIGQWISDRIEDRNIVCVIHTGDIVDNGFKDWEWENFDRALSQFYGKVPFVPIAGNHDIGTSAKSYKAYVKRPFLQDFSDEQKYNGGEMLYTVLEAGGEKILLLGIGWDKGKTKAELAWIDEVMSQYSDLPCILFTHGYVTDQKRILPHCAYLEKKVVSRYSNIRIVLSGHSREYYSMDFSYDDDGNGETDRTVHALMLNKQGKDYMFRILTVDPLTHDIAVETVSADDSVIVKDLKEFGPISFTIQNAY